MTIINRIRSIIRRLLGRPEPAPPHAGTKLYVSRYPYVHDPALSTLRCLVWVEVAPVCRIHGYETSMSIEVLHCGSEGFRIVEIGCAHDNHDTRAFKIKTPDETVYAIGLPHSPRRVCEAQSFRLFRFDVELYTRWTISGDDDDACKIGRAGHRAEG